MLDIAVNLTRLSAKSILSSVASGLPIMACCSAISNFFSALYFSPVILFCFLSSSKLLIFSSMASTCFFVLCLPTNIIGILSVGFPYSSVATLLKLVVVVNTSFTSLPNLLKKPGINPFLFTSDITLPLTIGAKPNI